jgi:hypothetical protein
MRKYIAQQRSPELEKEAAKKFGGYLTTGSGNKGIKGDVRVRGILRLEHKCTEKKSFSITREMAEKIEQAGLANDEIPALQIEFLGPTGRVLNKLAVIPLDVLEMLVSHEFFR